MNSILTSVKKMIGITQEDTSFDEDIIMHINTVFFILNQLGVGPAEPFTIEDDLAEWSMFLESPTSLQLVKTYMKLKVQLLFDPPSNSSITNAINQSISELEFRLNIAVDPGKNV